MKRYIFLWSLLSVSLIMQANECKRNSFDFQAFQMTFNVEEENEAYESANIIAGFLKTMDQNTASGSYNGSQQCTRCGCIFQKAAFCTDHSKQCADNYEQWQPNIRDYEEKKEEKKEK